MRMAFFRSKWSELFEAILRGVENFSKYHQFSCSLSLWASFLNSVCVRVYFPLRQTQQTEASTTNWNGKSLASPTLAGPVLSSGLQLRIGCCVLFVNSIRMPLLWFTKIISWKLYTNIINLWLIVYILWLLGSKEAEVNQLTERMNSISRSFCSLSSSLLRILWSVKMCNVTTQKKERVNSWVNGLKDQKRIPSSPAGDEEGEVKKHQQRQLRL